ncbi:MAG: AAA family ATPase [Dehalococcoidia bacterium]
MNAHLSTTTLSSPRNDADESPDDDFTFFDFASEPPAAPFSWLVNDLIPNGSSAILYGPSGIGKSFFAMDLALCVATGTAFHGRDVQAGSVLYLSCEMDKPELRQRYRAWQIAHDGATPAAGRFVASCDFISLDSAGTTARILRELESSAVVPVLVIVDTLAATYGAGRENDNDSARVYWHNLDRIRRRTGATVLVLHHPAKGKTVETRGGGELKAHVDTRLRIGLAQGYSRAAGVTAVVADKRRQGAPVATLKLRRRLVDCGDYASLVFETFAGSDSPTDAERPAAQRLSDTDQQVLTALTDGATNAQWKAACAAAGTTTATFDRAVQHIKKASAVRHTGRLYYHLSTSLSDQREMIATDSNSDLPVQPLSAITITDAHSKSGGDGDAGAEGARANSTDRANSVRSGSAPAVTPLVDRLPAAPLPDPIPAAPSPFRDAAIDIAGMRYACPNIDAARMALRAAERSGDSTSIEHAQQLLAEHRRALSEAAA